MVPLHEAFETLEKFRGQKLAAEVSRIEAEFGGCKKETLQEILETNGITLELLLAALLMKRSARQIDEIIHIVGILLAIPKILGEGEVVESMSLAAGNTGRNFDLVTNKRIAEFTFIQWQGGPEVIRQNKIFKDFFFLAEEDTEKGRELYTIGTAHPTRFFNSRRALAPILNGNAKLGESFRAKYPSGLLHVRDYCAPRLAKVSIVDLGTIVTAFTKEL